MNILALEVSTSSAKSIIYNKEKGIIDSNNIQFSSKISNVAIQDPDGVYKTVIKCVKEILNKNKIEIDIIGLSSTWHSVLLLDKERNPISKIRTWADNSLSKTASMTRKNTELNKWFYNKTGCPIHSIYPLWKIMYMIKENRLFNKDNIIISSKPEYIFEKLTNEVAISKSTASGTGIFNINKLDWDDEILKYAGINRSQLSPLKKYDYTGSLNNESANLFGLKKGTPVVITGPDGALNQIGSGALNNNIMTLSIGTSGAIRMVVNKPLIPDEPSTWCYYIGDGKRLAGAATSGAGNCVEWFKNNIDKQNQDLQKLSNKAKNTNKKDCPVFLPFLYGERCPGWKDNRKGGFFDLTSNHSIGELYYSILEGILFNLYQSFNILVNIDKKPKKIKISGGIINSQYWLQMAADIFQQNILISNIKDASLMGAIAISLKSLGLIEDIDKFKPKQENLVKPDKNKNKLYKHRYSNYLNWYNKTY